MIVHLNDDTTDGTELNIAAMHLSHAILLVQMQHCKRRAHSDIFNTENELPPSLIGWRDAYTRVLAHFFIAGTCLHLHGLLHNLLHRLLRSHYAIASMVGEIETN